MGRLNIDVTNVFILVVQGISINICHGTNTVLEIPDCFVVDSGNDDTKSMDMKHTYSYFFTIPYSR